MEASCLLKAVRNIMAMDSKWLMMLIQTFEGRIKKSLHSIALSLLQ